MTLNISRERPCCAPGTNVHSQPEVPYETLAG
jgi:hypothetical protein